MTKKQFAIEILKSFNKNRAFKRRLKIKRIYEQRRINKEDK
jgi:hypothetical protein